MHMSNQTNLSKRTQKQVTLWTFSHSNVTLQLSAILVLKLLKYIILKKKSTP